MRRNLLLMVLSLVLGICCTSCSGVPAYVGEADKDVATLKGKQWKLHDLTDTKVSTVSKLTGEDSPNKTLSRFGVWGTDLGSMTKIGDTIYMFCGDTYGSPRPEYGNWRSNVLFKITDTDPSDGLTIDSAITSSPGSKYAIELLPSLEMEGTELTVIPTEIFSVGNTLYCHYMRVKYWANQYSVWPVRGAGLARSKDKGQTWRFLDKSMGEWSGESNFVQTTRVQIGDTFYIWGVPSGRWGGVALMKVKTDAVEDMSAYEYYIGSDDKGAPIWLKGNEGIDKAALVLPETVGEICVNYNPHLGNFIMTYLDVAKGQLVMREGITPWGEWGEEIFLHKADGSETHHFYGGYMHPDYVENNGKTFYFAMSQWWPVYNIFWMKAELP